MHTDEIRALYAYDRWATRRVLAQLPGLDPEVWSRTNVVDERGLGGILVHQLGAMLRWRHGFMQDGETPRPEREPLPSIDELITMYDVEWRETDAWLPTLTDDFLYRKEDGVPVWQMLLHVVNHGTQHRSEAAALLTAEGRSPGDLDMIFWAEELAAREAGAGAGA